MGFLTRITSCIRKYWRRQIQREVVVNATAGVGIRTILIVYIATTVLQTQTVVAARVVVARWKFLLEVVICRIQLVRGKFTQDGGTSVLAVQSHRGVAPQEVVPMEWLSHAQNGLLMVSSEIQLHATDYKLKH